MSKRKRKEEEPREVRIPLGSLPLEALELIGRAGVLPGTTSFAEELRIIKPGNWKRSVRGVSFCSEDHRDGIIVGLLAQEARERYAHADDWIVLSCIQECEGRGVHLLFDREGLRELVNHLSAAVAESERREAEALGRR